MRENLSERKFLLPTQALGLQALGLHLLLSDAFHVYAATVLIEFYFAIDQRIDRKIVAQTNAFAGHELCSDLTDDDTARFRDLTTE